MTEKFFYFRGYSLMLLKYILYLYFHYYDFFYKVKIALNFLLRYYLLRLNFDNKFVPIFLDMNFVLN